MWCWLIHSACSWMNVGFPGDARCLLRALWLLIWPSHKFSKCNNTIFFSQFTFWDCSECMDSSCCTFISRKWMWRQTDHAVMTGFSGIHSHWVHVEKPEMFSVSGAKDVLHDECHPTEGWLGKITTVSSSGCVSAWAALRIFLWSSEFHLASSSSLVCFSHLSSWRASGAHLDLAQHFLFVLHIVCSLPREWCVKKECALFSAAPVYTKRGRDCHLYFPHAPNTELRNHLELIKISCVPLFVFPNCQQPSWTLHT